MGKNSTGNFYAVGVGRQVGIFKSWAECEGNVKGFPNAKFKKFALESEAKAFVHQFAQNQKKPYNTPFPQSSGFTAFQPQISSTSKIVPTSVHTENSSLKSSLLNLSEEDKFNHIIKASKRPIESRTQLLDSPVPRCPTKRLRVDSPNLKNLKSASGKKVYLPFILDSEDFVNVYTDGACLHNGQANPKAGVGVWFGDENPLNISQPVKGPPTNNNAEIQAARLAIEVATAAGIDRLRINTDSAFLIQCVTNWMSKWKKNDWKLTTGGDVKNRIELEKLDKSLKNIIVEWIKVPAHSGVHGNEMADRLASEGASKYVAANS